MIVSGVLLAVAFIGSIDFILYPLRKKGRFYYFENYIGLPFCSGVVSESLFLTKCCLMGLFLHLLVQEDRVHRMKVQNMKRYLNT